MKTDDAEKLKCYSTGGKCCADKCMAWVKSKNPVNTLDTATYGYCKLIGFIK